MEEEELLYTEQYVKTINLPALLLPVECVVSIVYSAALATESDLRQITPQNLGGREKPGFPPVAHCTVV